MVAQKNGLPGCPQEHLPLFCAKPATERMHNEHDNEKSRPIIKPASEELSKHRLRRIMKIQL